jgi:hypothetical protein
MLLSCCVSDESKQLPPHSILTTALSPIPPIPNDPVVYLYIIFFNEASDKEAKSPLAYMDTLGY